MKNAFKDPNTGTLTPGRNILSGMVAGVFASIFAVTPAERVKTALIDDARMSKRFTSTVHCVRTILKEDGPVGLYRGFAGTTMKQAAATGVRFGTYNIIKDYQAVKGIKQSTAVNFVNGCVAGVFVTLLTQPFDTVKTRSQSANATTTVQAVKSIWRDGGVGAFWRGTTMRLGRTVTAGGQSVSRYVIIRITNIF